MDALYDLLEDDEKESVYNEDVTILKQAWVSERTSPEILLYESETIARLNVQMDIQHQHIAEFEGSGDSGKYFIAQLYQMELDRIRFILHSYLRTRIEKIQKFVIHVNSTQDIALRLSDSEMTFAAGYLDLLHSNISSVFLQHLPEKFVGFVDRNEDVNMIDTPDLNEFVIIQIKEDIGEFQAEDEDLRINLKEGDILCVRYLSFRSIIINEQAVLI